MENVRILIADDHPVFLQGLRMTIESVPRLEVVGEAYDGNQALVQIRESKPDIVVLDLSMPEKNGFDIVQILAREKHATKFIFLTMHDEEATLNTALDLGVSGYVLKDSALAEIVSAVESVANGKNFITPKLSEYLVNRLQSAKDFSFQIENLTSTERRILRFIADHKTTREIAAELFVSIRTVDRHRYNICKKLNINGVNSLLKFAIENRSKFL